MAEFVDMIRDVGFPIFISVYLLLTQNKAQKSMLESIDRNTQALKELTNFIRGEQK